MYIVIPIPIASYRKAEVRTSSHPPIKVVWVNWPPLDDGTSEDNHVTSTYTCRYVQYIIISACFPTY